MVLHAGHGEFPRFVFAPGTPEQAFFLTNKAFDLAEKYQVSAFVLFDTYLSDAQYTCRGFDLRRLRRKDYRLRGDAFAGLQEYRRHALTKTGVSPFGVPGDSRHLVVTDSDEHDPDGHIVEDAETRRNMVDKRLFRKLPQMEREIAPPFFYGDGRPDIVLACWGSLYGIVREAVDELARDRRIAMLHFAELYPFPSTDRFDFLAMMRRAGRTICVEQNATGQLARLMRTETGYEFNAQVLKYDGRPFTVEELVKELLSTIKRS